MDFQRLDRSKASIGILAVVAIAAVVVIGPGLIGDDSVNNLKDKTAKSSHQSNQKGHKKVKLSNTRYARYAFKISGNSLSTNAKRALAGFNVKKSTSNGITTIHLNTDRSEYSDQTYKLKNGEQLYFIETSMGDDSGGNEYSIGDDTGVVVDSNGYIVRS
ncbi:MAG: hypothetical protein ABEJ87_04345 [Candidatus Nanohalobium sp.]